MCTASIIPVRGGFRLAVNRDELRARAPALRPTVVDLEGGGRAAWPTDADAGGTWIAVNDAGVALTLLNGNPRPMPPMPPEDRLTSRGLIIPGLIASTSSRGAMQRLRAIEVAHFAPFRLVAVDGDEVCDAVWDRRRLRVLSMPLVPRCFVSSGLGDDRARPRLGLFDECVARSGALPAAQDAFHSHRWHDRPEISVMMERPEARTVSVTIVTRSADGVRMHYRDDAGACAVSVIAEVRAESASLSHVASRRVPC